MTCTLPECLPFTKMHGCGNDFVFIDNRELRIPQACMEDMARKICRRAFGVGADGLAFLEAAPATSQAHYIWHFYNADGSRAEMCGNGSRCAARLAVKLGMAPSEHILGTDAGLIHAVVKGEHTIKVELTKPENISLSTTLSFDDKELTVHFATVGVPHAVVMVEDVTALDVKSMGAALRYHTHFAPAGTNVNFVQVLTPSSILLRTYERGVEDETYACGTGAAAAVFIGGELGLCKSPVSVKTTGGEVLGIYLEEERVFLEGGASITFCGEINTKELGL